MTEKRVTQLPSELKAWYDAHLPEAASSLNPGASEAALAAVEAELQEELGQGLPAELRELYLQNDGQDGPTVCGVVFGLAFSSLEQMLTDWRVWRDVARGEILDLDADFRELGTIYPPETIQNVYAHPGWLPFCRGGGGNHLALDLQPGPDGRVGQIINCGRDENNRRVLAPALAAFLEWLLAQYGADNYAVVTGRFDGREERCSGSAFRSGKAFSAPPPSSFRPVKDDRFK